MEGAENLYNNTVLNNVIEQQVIILFKNKIRQSENIKINHKDLRKSIWVASILAESKNEKYLKKVQDFAILLYLNNQENIEILKIVYILFSRIGNLAATNHLRQLNDNNDEIFSENIILIQELIAKRIKNSIIINNKSYLLTDFQKELFYELQEEKYISISAPTSSGKSFILKKYIEFSQKENSKYCVFYIVPSRALINQVSEELRAELENVNVKNAFIEDEIIDTGKIIYVITPERALKIINSKLGISLPDLVFIDEIQNVENEDGRGNLFEYVYEELSKVSAHTKIITAGPFISNSNEIFMELFNKSSIVVNTDLSPVFQLRTIIKLDDNTISLTLFANNKTFYTLDNIIEIDKIKTIFNSNIGQGLSLILASLTNRGESNLVYSSRGDYAEKWALKYSETIELEGKLEDDLLDLINYVKTEIHPRYYLISCLEKKVAFHHSSLSEFVRKEIESLFQAGVITTLFCTSTLLEGVNLPADNLFVIKPEKNTEKLSDFEFGNLIGRAGRLKNTLFGTIYCVSKNNNTSWAEEYYQASYLKVVTTSNSKALLEISVEDLSQDGKEIITPKIKNVITSLRNKALKNDGSFELYLIKQKLNKEKINYITHSINNSIINVTIPYSITKLNPTIDPLLQDRLYKTIIEEGINNWVIHPNTNFNTPYGRNVAETIAYFENSFFWQLNTIITRLDDIFGITKEIWKKDKISIYPSGITYNAISWIQGKSLGELIISRINYYSDRVPEEKRINRENQEHINKEIKLVIKINLKVITFSVLKYFKLLVDILEVILTEKQKEIFKLTLALPIQIELGTQEPIIISLISNGIPRTISLKLFEIFKKTIDYKNDVNIFDWMKNQNFVNGLDLIYNKFLIKNNFINKVD